MRPTAFTLIELLVVITIIVVLLALLTPALDKAIHQAEMAVCGSKVKTIATSVQVYAAGSKRRYPVRWEGVPMGSPNQIMGRVGYAGTDTWNPDCRPALRPLMSINAALNCPLTQEVNLDNESTSDNVIYAPYDLWFGFQFPNNSGMYKVGDRWSWAGKRFSVVASDFVATDTGYGYGSHPDSDGAWAPFVYDGEPNPFMADGSTPVTATLTWWQGLTPRGTVDLNFAYEDGSVQRIDRIGWENNPQLTRLAENIPSFGDGSGTRNRKVPMAD